MRIPSKLKRAALAAFRAGGDWSGFIAQYGDEVRTAEPYDQTNYHAMRGRLLHLIVSGEASGQFPPNDPDGLDPWERDDAPSPHDTETQARFDPAAAGVVLEPMAQRSFLDTTEAYR